MRSHPVKTNEHLNRQNVTVFYTLPRGNLNFDNNPIRISLILTETKTSIPFVSLSLYRYLYEILEKVNLNKIAIDHNLYSCIYTPIHTRPDIFKTYSSACGTSNKHISTVCNIYSEYPKRNSFFEYIELYQVLYLHNCFSHREKRYHHSTPVSYLYFGDEDNCTQYHQANLFLRKSNVTKDRHHLCTSVTPLHLFTNPIHLGKNTADFVFIDASNYLKDSIGSEEYQLSIRSILYFIISIPFQKEDGTLIIGLKDCFTELMVDFLYLISFFYDKTFMIKPTVCSSSASKRYLVCKGFRNNANDVITTQLNALFLQICKNNSTDRQIRRILQIQIPHMFIVKIEEINSILNQPRLEFIHQKINQYENRAFNSTEQKMRDIEKEISNKPPSTFEIKKSIDWCVRFRIPLNDAVHKWYNEKPSNKSYSKSSWNYPVKKHVSSFHI